jgi:hypothetical protein
MTTKIYKRPGNRNRALQRVSRQTTARSPVVAVHHATKHAAARPSPAKARTTDGARRAPSRLPQRSAQRRDGTNDWLKAGGLLVGFVVAVIVAVHVIGSPGGSAPTASSPPSNNRPSGNGNQPSSSYSQAVSTAAAANSGASASYLPPVVTTAKALGISPATLQSDIQAGETVPQLAQAQHVALSTVNAAYLEGVQQANEQAVQGGGVTQAQADQQYQQEVQQVQQGQYDILTGNYFTQQVP